MKKNSNHFFSSCWLHFLSIILYQQEEEEEEEEEHVLSEFNI
jgi:hypothetical protein